LVARTSPAGCRRYQMAFSMALPAAAPPTAPAVVVPIAPGPVGAPTTRPMTPPTKPPMTVPNKPPPSTAPSSAKLSVATAVASRMSVMIHFLSGCCHRGHAPRGRAAVKECVARRRPGPAARGSVRGVVVDGAGGAADEEAAGRHGGHAAD